MYLTIEGNASLQRPSKIDINSKFNMILADIDAVEFNIYNELENIERKLNKHLCNIWHILWNIMETKNDEFFTIRNLKNEEINIFNRNGEIILSECLVVDDVASMKISDDRCYNGLPVQVSLNNASIFAFLDNNGIIRK